MSLRRQRAAAAACALLAAGLGGCPGPKPGGPGLGQTFSAPAELLAAMRADLARLRAVRAEGSVDMRRGGERIKARVLFLAERPAWLRFETESFFEQPLSILVSDGARFTVWDLEAGRVVTGRASPENLGRVLPVPLDGAELAALLLGEPPWLAGAEVALADGGAGRGHILTLRRGEARQIVEVDAALLRPTRVELVVGGARRLLIEYEDWQVQGGLAVAPEKLRLEMPADGMHLKLKLRRVEPNPVLDRALFTLAPPEGTPLESLDPDPGARP